MKYEHVVIEQLRGYGRIQARLKILQSHPVGGGLRLSQVSGDDKLQELHRKLRGMPSKLYLTKREQEIETTARTYLKSYPLGTKAQLRESKLLIGESAGDHALLRELTAGIQAVLEARGGSAEGIDGVLDRLSEMQDLEQEKSRIEEALSALEEYKAAYSRLLRLRYIEGKAVEDVADELCVSRRTFERWRPKAVREYANLVGYGHME
ncbi:ECF-type sigma factor [Paenibacillus sp.]|uniref:ECF-type sigma factor n=1 Tax=Paenibacillus sp. TaxID=58172 RepID=UPI002811D459|nr:ECF-type sigma factor [Paenibacillus sp.]